MTTYNVTKDPQAVLDYGFDWTAWLNGDTIVASVWAVEGGITLDSESETATATIIWLSGGTAGVKYECTNTITTTAGRVDERTLYVRVQDR